MFNDNSALVKIWVRNVQEGKYSREEVPQLFNLRDVVYAILESK